MNTQPHFETLLKHITEALPQNLLNLHHDLEKNLRSALESALRRMNLVTREEFEVQQAVLTRTRARLEALEARITTLEETYLPKQLTPPDQHP